MSEKLIVTAPKAMKRKVGDGSYVLNVNPQSLQPESKKGKG